MGVVIDVFQDIIDDYNIEKFVVGDDSSYDIAGFYYCINQNVISIRLTFFNQIIFKNDVDLIDFTIPIKRLESMGYIVKLKNNGVDDRWVEIIIDFSNFTKL